jgi:outer membrane protein assembly factor BamB
MFGFGPGRTNYSPDTTITKKAIQSSSLVPKWSAALSDYNYASPAVVNGVVYIGSNGDDGRGHLYAFDAAGVANCSGATCTPLWRATITEGFDFSSPAVVDGVVYVNTDKLYAFDAAGTINCSGSPKTCTPLWTAPGGGRSSPAVADGVVYVGASNANRLYAFDAAGVTNCSGSPKTCAPLWTARTGDWSTNPAVADGKVYVASFNRLRAFDAAGVTNCTGSPTTCTPLWSAPTREFPEDPAVANGIVYLTAGDGSGEGDFDYIFSAFDAAGVTNCSGSPATCAPLWTTPTGDSAPTGSAPAVAHGKVYVTLGGLHVYDAAGVTNCTADWSGSKTCAPLWTASGAQDVVVADGVVYAGSASDAAGVINCSGSPKFCAPLSPDFFVESPVISHGTIYKALSDGLYAYRLEPHTGSTVEN